MTRLLAALCLALFAATLAGPAAAQTRNPPPKEIIFGDGDDVLGATLAPDESIVTVKDAPEFESLIALRKNFRQRLLSSIGEL